jgi:hypothetical protein
MPSTEVQRTLVKSPPELWAELGDPESLAKHLGAFGEIRATRIEPETAVEWEAAEVKGAVRLKASGWGTKVTLTVERDAAVAPTPEPSAEIEPAAKAVAEPETEPEPEQPGDPPATTAASETPADVAAEADAEPEPEPRRGFFARLFRRRRTRAAAEVASVEPPDPEPAATEPPEPDVAAAEPPSPEIATEEPTADPAPPPPDLAAELAAIEEAMVEQDTAVLTDLLDRLGAAHHRPFSRG